jgi:hypothetical protein
VDVLIAINRNPDNGRIRRHNVALGRTRENSLVDALEVIQTRDIGDPCQDAESGGCHGYLRQIGDG